MNPIVVGAGPVGLAVSEELVAQGLAPILVSRSSGHTPQGCTRIAGSVFDPDLIKDLPTHPTVFHCANAPYNRWVQELPSLWEAVTQRARESGGRIIAATNLYAYGRPLAPMDVNHPRHPHTRKGRVRNQVERSLMDSDIPAILVRASDFYGPRVIQSAFGDRYFLPILRGRKPSWPGRADRVHSVTYIKDLARVMVQAAMVGTWGEEWIVPEETACTAEQLTARVGSILEKSVTISPMGRGTLHLGGLFVPAAREMVEMLYEFEKDFVIDGQRTIDRLGVEPTLLNDALKETIEWYRSQTRLD